jgi:hypothetical protein
MEEVLKIAESEGIDVVDVIINAISKKDPSKSINIRLDLAKKYFTECEDYIRKGDPIQASEKAYKVVEELVKALAEKFNLEEYKKALIEGKWYTNWLVSASSKLSKSLGNWVINGWDAGYTLHVWGFHESKLSIDDVIPRVNEVKKMLEESEKILKG